MIEFIRSLVAEIVAEIGYGDGLRGIRFLKKKRIKKAINQLNVNYITH